MYIYSNVEASLLYVETKEPLDEYQILDAEGNIVDCPLMRSKQTENSICNILDATALTLWTLDSPVLYTLKAQGEEIRFGHTSIAPMQNKAILLNGSPVYLRGYIRGIVAHDHPNMTGGSDYEAALKNVRQAKKYGFNLVRFHSTIPSEEFVRAADELGLLIHMEIGFAYEYDSQGHKKNLSMSNDAWEKTILRYRNHPSVAVFCIGNEMHNAGRYPEVHKLYETGKKLAPSKLIMDNSGWGEYDRTTADIYSQHIAYFFPYKHHSDMFLSDAPWSFNGSVKQVPLELENNTIKVHRQATPIRPTLSHEAMHYIDIPDYNALNAKFDRFAAEVGEAYLQKHGIKKPRFMTELPQLIREKGLQEDMPDLIAASRKFKEMGTKVFIERLRLADNLCGFEMLQFSDCLKYENKNGIVDCFDDDKGIDPVWMKEFNSDLVLLADLNTDTLYEDEALSADIYVSDYLPNPQLRGTLTVMLDGETLYEGEDFALAGGLQKLAGMTIHLPLIGKAKTHTLEAVFVSDTLSVHNSWQFWSFPRVISQHCPELAVENRALEQHLQNGKAAPNTYLTDRLDEKVFEKLNEGKNVVLLYEYQAKRNLWQLPGALERFKPCIWDRGSNLGGIIYHDVLREVLGEQRYFDRNLQPVLEAGCKVNLDHFPCPVAEHMRGIDKPVRDRMKGLIHGVKGFIADDTLRRFSHLFSLRVGNGLLIVCTLNFRNPKEPVAANILRLLTDHTVLFDTDKAIAPALLRKWLQETNDTGFQPEDVMNHFWEIDNKPVEDTLFWEEAGVDLAKMKG